jgi:Ni,Fe-hydrogenase III small subunit
VFIPGCPPRPQALIHGLLVALERREPRLRLTGGELGPDGDRGAHQL